MAQGKLIANLNCHDIISYKIYISYEKLQLFNFNFLKDGRAAARFAQA